MVAAVSERDPYAEFAEDTSKRPDINAGRDLDVAAIFPAVASKTLGRAFAIQTSVPFMDAKYVLTICLCTIIISRDTLGLCCYQAACTKIGKPESVLVNRDIGLALRQYVLGLDVLMNTANLLAATVTYRARRLDSYAVNLKGSFSSP